MEEVKFTDEEIAQLEGRDMEPEEEPVRSDEPVLEPLPPEEDAEASAVESEAPAQTEEQDYDKMKKANAGLLNELVRLRKQSREDREWRQAVEERMELLNSKFAPEEDGQVEDAEPDKDEDPVGWLEWRSKQLVKEEIEPLKAKEEEEEQQRQYSELIREAATVAQQAERDFLESSGMEAEDYGTKLDELRYDRLNWYVASGASPDQAVAIVEEEERNFVLGALANNKNPAAEIVRLHGQIKPRPIPKGEHGASPSEQESRPRSKVSATKAGSREGGLQNVGGSGSPGGVITAEQLADMDADDPIVQKIMGNEKLWTRLNIYGQVTI